MIFYLTLPFRLVINFSKFITKETFYMRKYHGGNMDYSENREKAGEYLRLVLNYIAKYRLSATPVNYAVLYEYVSGKNHNLHKTIDDLIDNNKPLDTDTVAQFYQKYIAEEHREIVGNSLTEIKKILRDIKRYILETQGDLIHHDKNLRSIAAELDDADHFELLGTILDKMLNEAKGMILSGKDLNSRMDISSNELELLKKKLEKYKQDAETDALTGLANRRKLEKQLGLTIKKSLTDKTPLSLIMVDIDHFKRINDTFGHLTGDGVLRVLAALFRQQLKGKDLPARFGGEEFMLMLPDTSLEDAAAVAENIRSVLTSREWKQKVSGKSMGKITISLGVAEFKANESIKSLIERTDKALYFAKKNGRNQVATEKNL